MQVNLHQYVTTLPNSGHRIGHKLDDLITGFILAEWYSLKYLHSPLPDRKWESFFGFGDQEELFTDFYQREQSIPIISCSPLFGVRRLGPKSRYLFEQIPEIEYRFRRLQKRVPIEWIREWREPYWDGAPLEYIENIFAASDNNKHEVIYCFQKAFRVMPYQIHRWGKEGKVDPNIYYNVLKKLRTKYHSKKHPEKKSYFDSDSINIAVHVRRDDASVENGRFLPLKFYEGVIQQLDQIFKNDAHEFHIYSSGSDHDMAELINTFKGMSSRIKFHLNESAMEAVHHMVIADVLVVGHSSFSHWSGFLSQNVKLYHPHFHMWDLDENEWIVVDDDGKFSEVHLKHCLAKTPLKS